MKSSKLRTVFDIPNIKNKISFLKEETEKSEFWGNPKRAGKINQEIAEFEEELNFWGNLEKETKELINLVEYAQKDLKLIEEIEQKYKNLEEKFKKEEFRVFLSGKYDRGNAILNIYSGAGGVDAQDWTSVLLRTYQRYAEARGYETIILHQHFGEGIGSGGPITKNVTLEIKGKYAYGYLKGENGVHRLVRISPFSAQKLRHTSFALVEVLPEIPEPKLEDIEVKPEDLKIDTFRASGPGGQYVNRRESAVRIHHLPSGITVACQAERLQGENKERAMKLLLAKLYALKLQREKTEFSELKAAQWRATPGGRDKVSPEWGNQIRSYVLHPYKLVKDHRTNVEVRDVEGVLDGKLDEFIEAELTQLPAASDQFPA